MSTTTTFTPGTLVFMQPWESLAEEYASTMAHYQEMHAESAQVLSLDPTKRDRMLQDVKDSNEPHIRKQFDTREEREVDEMLRVWNEAIDKEPKTFEDHFYRLHYAFAAVVYYTKHRVDIAIHEHGHKFFRLYSRLLSVKAQDIVDRLVPGGPKTRPTVPVVQRRPQPHRNTQPPRNPQMIDIEGANALLAVDDTVLTFQYMRQNATGEAEVWKVISIKEKRTMRGYKKEYEVVFDHDNEQSYEILKDELVELLSESIIYDS